jgi:hypothetical protein
VALASERLGRKMVSRRAALRNLDNAAVLPGQGLSVTDGTFFESRLRRTSPTMELSTCIARTSPWIATASETASQ